MISDKIALWSVIQAHFETMRHVGDEKISLIDLFTFYGLPLALAFLGSLVAVPKNDAYMSAVIAVYAIFSALLLNAQVGLYTIFRSWTFKDQSKGDPASKNSQIRDGNSKIAKQLVIEVNSNLSYLIMISMFSLTITFVFVAFEIHSKFEFFVVLLLMTHFFLTLLMVVKRMFRLFEVEFKS